MSEVVETTLRELSTVCQTGMWSESEYWGAIERAALVSPRSGSSQGESNTPRIPLSELAAWSTVNSRDDG